MNIEIQQDLENLKNFDKSRAIIVVMHLIDAAEQLVLTEPYLALSLTNLANVIQKKLNIQQSDIDNDKQIIDTIKNAKTTIKRVRDALDEQ